MPSQVLPCAHCHKPPGKRPRRRGLCADCHAKPDVRRLYAKKPSGRGAHQPPPEPPAPLPDLPTLAPPGSPSKVRVMAKRALEERCLFHPMDRVCVGHIFGQSAAAALL
jgi:hypothetical protein